MAGIGTSYLDVLSTAPASIAPTGPFTLPASATALPRNERPSWGGGYGSYKSGLGGLLQRIGDGLKAPGVAPMLARSGIATMQGGLGAGLQAGADYQDGQKAIAAKAHQTEFENRLADFRAAIEKQQADQTGRYQNGQLNLGAGQLEEDGRSHRAREKIDAYGQVVQKYGIDKRAETDNRGFEVSASNNKADNLTSENNSKRTFDASIHGDNTQAFIAGVKPAGIGGGAYFETKTKLPARTEGGNWLGYGGTKVPASVTTTRVPFAASPTYPQATAPMAAGALRPGAVVDGMTYLGGDPNNRASWR